MCVFICYTCVFIYYTCVVCVHILYVCALCVFIYYVCVHTPGLLQNIFLTMRCSQKSLKSSGVDEMIEDLERTKYL